RVHGAVDAVEQAQAEPDRLALERRGVELFARGYGGRAQPFVDGAGDAEALAAAAGQTAERVGRAAEPEVLAAGPIERVVHGAPAGAGPARDLVVAEAGGAEARVDALVHLGAHARVGHDEEARALKAAERGAILDGEVVDRDVLGLH